MKSISCSLFKQHYAAIILYSTRPSILRKIAMIATVILVGGSSKRFGVNKLTYEVNGEAMIRRVFNAAKEITENIYLSVKNREQAISLLKLCGNPRGVIEDSYSEVDGPINGIITSIKKIAIR